jgi:hypothetical protein
LSAFQYGLLWKRGLTMRPVNTALRFWSHRNSGVVKPTFQSRRRILSGRSPAIASLKMCRLHPPRIIASSGRASMCSTSSWSRYGTRDSMEKAMEFLSS